jgi:phospholipase/carboxylesterase
MAETGEAGPEFEPLAGVVEPLLRSLEALGHLARHCHPTDLADLLARMAPLGDELDGAQAKLGALPEWMSALSQQIEQAMGPTLVALRKLESSGDLRGVWRALRWAPEAREAIYPLAGILPPVNRFFLDPSVRDDEALQARYMRRDLPQGTGVMEFGEEGAERGGFMLYVPETYDGSPLPLVMALHGGGGTGRGFLWSWLREARTHGAILAAPTSLGETWALSGEDVDTPMLANVLAFIEANWNVDPAQLLLTGMSDGGTFALFSGLEAASPFTHLAPAACGYQAMFVEVADEARLRGLPIHFAHGVLDWMFPIERARQAQAALVQAGANLTYVEPADLSHCYPRELNGPILNWMAKTAR